MNRWLAGKMGYALPFLRVTIVAALGMGLAGPALALECPAEKPLERHGVLKETPAQTADMTKMLVTGDVGNNIRFIVLHLQTRYPEVENAEIINYILNAYCPVVAENSTLTEQQKEAKLDQFVGQVIDVIK